MQIHYAKMHGAGNRIVVVDNRSGVAGPPSPAQIRLWGDAASGPGFDQLMWLEGAAADGFAATYRVFNADGSEVEQCGNGVRCVAWLLAAGAAGEIHLQSPVGPIEARVHEDGQVAVNMGQPVFAPAAIPFEAAEEAPLYTLKTGAMHCEAAVLSMGNPHCVLRVSDVDSAPVNKLGPALENHERFPERCNVGFMQEIDRDNIRLRVYERGVGETLACGTGACAAVVAGRRLGRLHEAVRVVLPGGELMVSWRGPGQPVWLTGDAQHDGEGTIEL